MTAQNIMAEENVAVRIAKMTVFGMDRFLLEAGAKVIDDYEGYQLLELEFDQSTHIRALKMTCPSTGAVYINTVPPTHSTVRGALDWIFNCMDYLERVSQAT